jgi:integrase
VDFEGARIRIVIKGGTEALREWEPKDHEGRVLPIPLEVVTMLADLQAESVEGCPYVFVPGWRWEYIQQARKDHRWSEEHSLVDNLIRRLTTLRKRVGVAKFTYHDLRRTCITNWARHLPTHVVQKLAGHSDIKTTQQYYLSVQEEDLGKARRVQSEILKANPTDPLLTHLGQNDHFGAP